MNHEQTFHTPNVVQQRREEAAAINAVMNPAGKTDKELGSIGAKAAFETGGEYGNRSAWLLAVHDGKPGSNIGYSAWRNDELARTAFARAVREAVEAKQAEEINEAHAKIEELTGAINVEKESDNRFNRACKDYNEEIARLTAELEQAQVKLATGAERFDCMERALRGTAAGRDENYVKLRKANAELERLRWRPVSVKPTKEDADKYLQVVVSYAGREMEWGGFYAIEAWPWAGDDVACWRPFCPPPALTAEEKSRTEFEAWIKQMFPGYALSKTDTGSYKDLNTRIAFAGWQAHASKEVK